MPDRLVHVAQEGMTQVSRPGVDRSGRGQREAGGDAGPGMDEPRDDAPGHREHSRLLDADWFGVNSGMHLDLPHLIRSLSTKTEHQPRSNHLVPIA